MELLWSVSLRVLAPAALAGALLAAARVKSAAVRHAVWTAVTIGMLLSLALAALTPPVELRVLPRRSTLPVNTDAPLVEQPVPAIPTPTTIPVAAMVYAAGVAAGLIRLACGYGFTRRLLRGARQVEGDLYESGWIAVPITIGWLRPKILLPEGWRDWDRERMEAVLAHEREHVRRGDWAIAGMAAINRCAFWFHPLAWWLERKLAALAEQACDDAAILATGRRAQYAEVLLEMAAAVKSNRGRLLGPAMAMAKRTEVHVRIDRILDETKPVFTGLSRRRRAALVACGLPLAYAAAALQLAPARAVAQEQQPQHSVQAAPPAQPAPQSPAAVPEPAKASAAPSRRMKPAEPAPAEPEPKPLRILRRVEPEYPQVAKTAGAHGVVEMEVTVAPDGRVKTVKAISGHPMLIDAAVEAVKQWVYTPQPAEVTTAVKLAFAGETLPQRGQGNIQQAVLISRKEPVYPEEAKRAGAMGMVTLNATIDKEGRVREVHVISGHPMLQQAAVDAVREWRYRPTMLNGAAVETETQIVLNFAGDKSSPPAAAGAGDGSGFESAKLISRREPVYAGGALKDTECTVTFRATIGVDGRPSNIRAGDGAAECVAAALEAVKQWMYRPARLNGKPVESETQIALKFAARRGR